MSKLEEEIKKSKFEKLTSPLLMYFIFNLIEESLFEVYGKNSSMKCLQSSIAIQKILKQFGIESKIHYGSCCFSLIEKKTKNFCWGGFWDKDHHVWLITEFEELIDFTISLVHLHPKIITKNDFEEIPPLW